MMALLINCHHTSKLDIITNWYVCIKDFGIDRCAYGNGLECYRTLEKKIKIHALKFYQERNRPRCQNTSNAQELFGL